MAATGGRIVQTRSKAKPYKVVLQHAGRPDTELGVETIREGEAMIAEETPNPPKRSTLMDRPASDA